MALELTHIVDGQLPSVKTDLYEVPANKAVIITSIIATNTSSSQSRTVNFYLDSGGGSRHITPVDRKLEPGQTMVFDNFRAALAETFKIQGQAAVATEIDYWISGVIQDV